MQATGVYVGAILPMLVSGGGEEKASVELLEAMEEHGRVIEFAAAGSEELRYLDGMGAEANVGGPGRTNLLLRESPTKVAALEEFLHGT